MNKREYWSRRLKNKTFWVSLGSSTILLLQLIGIDLLPSNSESIFNVVLTILTLLGVLNDPTNSNGIFVDSVDLNGNGIPDYLENLGDDNIPQG